MQREISDNAIWPKRLGTLFTEIKLVGRPVGNQCDPIKRFLIVLGNKFCMKSRPNISSLFGLL